MITKLALKLFAGPLARHLIAFLGGYLSCDAGNVSSLIGGAVAFGVSVLLSLVAKRFPKLLEVPELTGPDAATMKDMIVGSVTSQFTAAFSGWLMASGYLGDMNDTASVMLFIGNLFNSKSRSQKLPSAAVKALLLCGLCLSQIACGVTTIPLPGQDKPMVLVNTDVRDFNATATSVSFSSLSHSEPIKAQGTAVQEGMKIWGNTRLGLKGLDAATSLGSTAAGLAK